MSDLTKANNRALALVYATIFLDVLGLGVLIPVLPYYAQRFSADAMTVGLLSAVFSVAQFTSSPLLGAISDRYGRRRVILANILGSAFGYFLFGWASTLWVLMLARVIEGVTGGSISTAQAYIADVTPPEDRMKRFGLIGAVFGVGFIIGPAFGGFLSSYSLAMPAYAAGSLCLAAAIFGYFMLPESLPVERRIQTPLRLADANPIRQIAAALQRDSIRAILFAIFAVNVAFSALQSNFAFFTMKRFGMGPQQNAWIFVYIGVLSVLMQGVVVRRLPKHWNPLSLCITGLIGTAIGLLGISFSQEEWQLFPSIAVMAFGNGVAAPMLTALVSRRVGASEQGTVLGSTQSILSSTRIVGPIFAGYVFDAFGSGAPYWMGAILVVAGVAIVAGAPSETALKQASSA
ncbi:MFS transporter [Bryobacter aggregatus]|uniref:MFS transporter n=1 Tax=Bryobacter aggregatus TaxID=360054 RepID=UPI000689A547|nr:MFS transporter [Bryobacter aggregatus]